MGCHILWRPILLQNVCMYLKPYEVLKFEEAILHKIRLGIDTEEIEKEIDLLGNILY